MSVSPGQIIQTNNGPVTVMEKVSSRHAVIIFHEPPYTTKTVQITALIAGTVANRPSRPVGRHRKYPTLENGVATPAYSVWMRMKSEVRKGATIHPGWLNFQTFAEWYYERAIPTDEFKWMFTHKLFNLRNDRFIPKYCDVLPGPLARIVLNRHSKLENRQKSAEYYKRWISPELYEKLMYWRA